MPIVIIFILVFGSILVAWFMPRLREIAIGILILFESLLGYLFFSNGSETERQAQFIGAEEITLTHLNFNQEPRAYYLSGNMLNASNMYRLQNVNIRVTMHDCATPQTELSDCLIIADDTGFVRVDIPAGQVRSFKALLQFSDLPEIEGTLRWHQEIVSTRAIR